MVMPVANPTGNPYPQHRNFKLPDMQELKGLQVKAELSKLGDAPRSYSELLQASIDSMAVDSDMVNEVSQTGRLWITERFEKIERARAAVPQLVVNFSKKLQELLPSKSKPAASGAGDKQNAGNKPQTEKQKSVARLQKRAQVTGRGGKRF